MALDPRNGEVLAFVSKPTFDPNLFVDGIDFDSWRELNESIDKPLLNRALRGTYPPGSTFKPFMAMAALNSGKRGADGQVTQRMSALTALNTFYGVLALVVLKGCGSIIAKAPNMQSVMRKPVSPRAAQALQFADAPAAATTPRRPRSPAFRPAPAPARSAPRRRSPPPRAPPARRGRACSGRAQQYPQHLHFA